MENVLDQEVVSEAIKRQDAIYGLVRENIATAQNKYKLPKSPKQACFQVGDMVLRKNIRSQQRKGGKMDKNWLGPFTVVAITKKSADLQSDNQFLPKVNIDHLRIYKTPQPRMPRNLLAPPSALAPSTAPAPPTTLLGFVFIIQFTCFLCLFYVKHNEVPLGMKCAISMKLPCLA